jgi:hypothetical protein
MPILYARHSRSGWKYIMAFKHISILLTGTLVLAAAAGFSTTSVFGKDPDSQEPAVTADPDNTISTEINDLLATVTDLVNTQLADLADNMADGASAAVQQSNLQPTSLLTELASSSGTPSTDGPSGQTTAPDPNLDTASSTSVATSGLPGPVTETITKGNATAQTSAEVISGGEDGLSVSFNLDCAGAGSCASSTAVTVSAGGQGVAFSSSVSSSAGSTGSATAKSDATSGNASCGPVAPALKTEYGPDGKVKISYQYSTGGGCAKTETVVP